jgi:hypothetical protein
MWLFNYNLENKKNPILSMEVVEVYFKELLSPHFSLVEEFLKFMEDKKYTTVTQDQWNCFLDLLKQIGDQFPKNYTPEDFWPTLFDEFFYWYCDKYKIPYEKPEY